MVCSSRPTVADGMREVRSSGRPPVMPSSAAREHPLGAYSRRFPAPAAGDGGVAAVDVGRQFEAAFGSWSTAA
jgi:hypothetical protein